MGSLDSSLDAVRLAGFFLSLVNNSKTFFIRQSGGLSRSFHKTEPLGAALLKRRFFALRTPPAALSFASINALTALRKSFCSNASLMSESAADILAYSVWPLSNKIFFYVFGGKFVVPHALVQLGLGLHAFLQLAFNVIFQHFQGLVTRNRWGYEGKPGPAAVVQRSQSSPPRSKSRNRAGVGG